MERVQCLKKSGYAVALLSWYFCLLRELKGYVQHMTNQIVSLTTTGQQISGSIMALVGGIGFIVFSRELINEFPNSPQK